ncbi:MAG: permease prefix domain 1-containing protein [Chloroflexota bacterium]|nr:permease prefix domain 1-containing protein [Chloroflexota bacterium]
MESVLGSYLTTFKASLQIDSYVKESVAQELYTHLKDKSQELKGKGFSEEEADKFAVKSLGSPELVARQIYETHAQGSWQDAFLAALPHLIIALFFASYYWQNTTYLSVLLVTIVSVAIYGWHQNKPLWFFPWLGYYLLPVVVSGILLVYLSKGWGLVAMFVYVPLALFVVIYMVQQTVRRDGIYALLMLSPLPIMFGWLLSLGRVDEFISSDTVTVQLGAKAPWITVTFFALALATVAFVRLKQRRHKIAVLLIPSIAILTLAVLVGAS